MFEIQPEKLGPPQSPDTWHVPGADLGLNDAIWLVHRIPAHRPALETFAVLGRAASAASDTCRPAMAWRRIDTHYWLATPLPAGAPATSAVAEPLAVWMQVAHAVSALHARGIVHGNIGAHTVWVDGRQACLTGVAYWAAGQPAPARQDDLQALVDLYGHLTASQTRLKTPEHLNHLGSVDALIDVVRAAHAAPVPTVTSGRIVALEATENPRFGEGIKFQLIAAESDNALHGAFFWRKAHGPVYESLAHAWDGAEVRFDQPHVVTDSEGRRFLTGKPETVPVLEPHWFVSVTDVIKLDGCVNRYFVDQRTSEPPGRPIVLGNILHGLLEDLIAGDKSGFISLWQRQLDNSRWALLAAGLGDDDLERLRNESEAHFDHLRGFASGRDRTDRYSWSGESTEVARYSTRFGLEGRIDVVTEEPQKRLNIVELKTGSVREEHADQVQAYRLLWDAYATRSKEALSGYLLYSREGTVRPVAFDDARPRVWLRERNKLVAAHHALAHGRDTGIPHFGQFPAECASSKCRFRKKSCEEQCRTLGLGFEADVFGDPELTREMRRWWHHFTRLVEAEYWTENHDFGESFREDLLDERIREGRCLPALRVVEASAGSMTLEGKLPTLSPNAPVLLHQGDPADSVLLRGFIQRAHGGRVVLNVPSLRARTKLPSGTWHMELVASRMGLRAAHQNLYAALSGKRRDLASVLTGRSAWNLDQSLVEHPSLNAQQSQAVQAALHASPGCLIQGPPGTGKTTVIAHAVHALRQHKNVLVCAQTNTALDTLLEKLIGLDIPFLRVGASHRCESLARALDAAHLDPTQYFSDDHAAAASSLEDIAQTLKQARVVGCTVYSLSSSDVIRSLERLRGPRPFDVVIMDEATQITEPLAVGALVRAERFVLVGDHRQLPPVVLSDATPVASDDPMNLGGLEQSLFERLHAMGAPSIRLEQQYRMNTAIMAFSNRLFYGGLLQAAPSAAQARLDVQIADLGPRISQILDPNHPVVFVDVRGTEHQRVNEAEVAVIQTLAAHLIELEVPARQIGVVSPFRAQVEAIRPHVGEVDCDTVERFQGGERDVMLFSMVRTERTGAFITDERRLNVALTRARTKLIIVGHRSCLSVSALFRDLLEQPETTVIEWHT